MSIYFIYILFLRNDRSILNFFCCLPFVKKVPKRVQILFFIIYQVLLVLVLKKVVFTLGYVFMDDLTRAVAQFYASSGGGMSGGF